MEEEEKATHVEIKGIFVFSINQHGLDYKNKEERQQAIDDFWKEFIHFQETVNELQQGGYLSLEYNHKDLLVQEGEV